jgi:hypothetical protein
MSRKQRIPEQTAREGHIGFWRYTVLEIKKEPILSVIYLVLRILVILVMVRQAMNHDYNNVFMCLLTLLLFTIPSFVEHRLKIDVPNTLEVIVLLFIFAAEILGEITEYYLSVPYWDTMLHAVNGFLCAAIGIAMIDILNRSDRFMIKLSPIFVAFVAFCFSMTIGVVWEFFEFFMDQVFKTDMQKDTIVKVISSINLNPDGRNVPITLYVNSLAINGQDMNLGGYLDIGLMDTMKDLMVNFIGAVVFSVIGYFYIKGQGNGKFAKRFIPRLMMRRGKEGTETKDSSEKIK